MKKTRRREKSCQYCFAYIPANSRKCKFCGNKSKSSGTYLFGIIKEIFQTNKIYSVNKVGKSQKQQNLFTAQEIENLLKMDNLVIPMFLVLDDLAFMDEMALIELGETISRIDEI